MDIFLFIAAILSMIATVTIIHLVCRHTKLKALLRGITFQPVKQTEAIFHNGKEQCHCTTQWYTIAALTLMIIGLIIYIFNCTKMQNFQKKVVFQYSYSDAILFRCQTVFPS